MKMSKSRSVHRSQDSLLRKISSHSSNECPFAVTLSNISLNASLGSCVRNIVSETTKNTHLKVTFPERMSIFPCLLFSFPYPRLSVMSVCKRFSAYTSRRRDSFTVIRIVSRDCAIPAWMPVSDGGEVKISRTNQSDNTTNFLSLCMGG